MSKLSPFLAAAFLAALAAIPARGTTCENYFSFFGLEATRDFGGSVTDVELVGPMGYVTAANEGLRIVDFDRPAEAPLVIDTPGYARGVFIQEPYAFVADESSLQIVELPGPLHNGVVVGSVPMTFARDVFAQDGFAYVADGAGLRVVDVSTPSSPLLVSTLPTTNEAFDVVVRDGLAYVGTVLCTHGGCNSGSLVIVDVTDPLDPTELGSLPLPGGAPDLDLSLDGEYAYVAGSEVRVVDVTDPNSPSVVTNLPLGRALDVSGDRLYTGSYLRVYDLADPRQPELIISGGGGNEALSTDGGRVLSATSSGELYLHSVLHETALSNLGMVATEGEARRFAVSEDEEYIYVAAALGGLRVVDVTNPASPVEVATVTTAPFTVDGVAADGDRVFFIERSGSNGRLSVLDVSDPTDPTLLGSVELGRGAFGLSHQGNYSYVATLSGMTIVDVSTATNPQIVTEFLGFGAWEVDVQGSFAYLVGSSRFQVVQVSTPTSPTLVGTVTMRARDVLWHDDVAYVVDDAVTVVDVSTPNEPTVVSSVHVGGSTGLSLDIEQENRIVYALGGEGMVAVDMTDLTLPRIIRSSRVNGTLAGGAVTSEFVLAGGWETIALVPHHCRTVAETPSLESPNPGFEIATWPNPFLDSITIEFELSEAERVSLQIMDVGGRRVRRLWTGQADAGSTRVSWDGRDDRGRPVASGMYFAVVSDVRPQRVSVREITVLR